MSDVPKEDSIDDAKYKLRDVVNSYVDIAFVESNGELLDGAIEALERAKKFLGKKESKLDSIFGGKGTTLS